MAGSKPLDIVARFRTVTTDFNTRQVEQELDDVDRAFRDSERASSSWSRTVKRSADDAADGVRKGGSGFREAGKELGSEFSENIGEGLRSGDLRGSVLETFTSLGPALGAAGIAVGVGAAIVNGIVQGIEENARKVREALKNAYGDAVDEVFGGSGGRTIADIIGSLSGEDIQNIQKAGYSVGQFAAAVYEAERGDTRKLDAISGALDRRADAIRNVGGAAGGKGGGGSAQAAARITEQLAGVPELSSLIDKTTEAIRRRTAAYEDLIATAAKADVDKLEALGGTGQAVRRDPDYNRGRR